MSAITGSAAALTGVDAERRESTFRLVGASVLTFFWFLLFLGTSWDIMWHSDVGPDRFWTAPHTMMYSGVAVAGLVSLYMVVATTVKFRRGAPGVTKANTTPWLGIFRAPLGFILSGVGVVGFLMSGGFDEFWHGMYGFDVTLWSPPHVSLLLSGIVGVFGAVYAMASEVSRARARGELRLSSVPVIGFVTTLALLILYTSVITPPAMTEKLLLGPFSLYPLMAGSAVAFVLVLAAAFLRMPGAATLTALLVTAIRFVAVVLPPLMVDWQARFEGLPYKPDKVGFTLTVLATPAWTLLAGVVVDLVYSLGQRYTSRMVAAVLAGVLAPVALFAVDRPWFRALDALPWVAKFGNIKQAMLSAHQGALYPTFAAVAVLGALTAWLGANFAVYLRYTEK